ncbi:MAG: hypothetical protein V1799_12500 [bacterium]
MSTEKSHWATDEELRERFVAGRVSKEEQRLLAQHLHQCDMCNALVRDEQILAAGIKRTGRIELQARLRARINNLPRQVWTWYQVAGAAAVILLLLTLGIHNQWFMREAGEALQGPVLTEESTPGEEGKTKESGSKGVADEAMQRNEEKRAVKEILQGVESNARGKDKRYAPSSADDGLGKQGVPKGITAAGEKTGKTQTTVDGTRSLLAQQEKKSVRRQEEGGAGAQKPEVVIISQKGKSELDEVMLAAQLREVEADYKIPPTITIGSVVSEQGAGGKGKGVQRRQMLQQLAAEPKMQAIIEGRTQILQKSDRQFEKNTVEEISILQRYSSTSLLSAMRSDGQTTIPAYFTIKNSTLIVLLLVNPLFEESALRSASAEFVQRDSIVINIAGKRLGYRLPERISNQMPAVPNK